MALSTVGRGIVVLIATFIGVALTANLGAWQLRRAAQKVALQSSLDSRSAMPTLTTVDVATTSLAAEPQHYRAVRLRGHWVDTATVFLDNRQMDARVGFYVVTPLLLAGRSDAILVQRGWVPRDLLDRTRLPSVATPAGDVDVELVGHIAPPPARLYEFAGAASGVIRQNLELAGFSDELNLKLAPLSVQQDDSPATLGDGLLRRWSRPALDVQKHYGYAFQWFALCALMAGLYVWFQLLRPRLRHR
jgi:surfeit locus 1 family protein